MMKTLFLRSIGAVCTPAGVLRFGVMSIVGVVFVSMILASCTPIGPSNSSQPIDVIMPLKVGNTWTYQAQTSSEITGTSFMIPPATSSLTVQSRVVSERSYKGQQGFVVVGNSSNVMAMSGMMNLNLPNSLLSSDSVIHANRTDGLYTASLASNSNWIQNIRFPVKANDSWTLPDTTSMMGADRVTISNQRITVISVNASVVVTAGTFSCYQYQFTADIAGQASGMAFSQTRGIEATYSYAVNKGLIKAETSTKLSISGFVSTVRSTVSLQSLSLQ